MMAERQGWSFCKKCEVPLVFLSSLKTTTLVAFLFSDFVNSHTHIHPDPGD